MTIIFITKALHHLMNIRTCPCKIIPELWQFYLLKQSNRICKVYGCDEHNNKQQHSFAC
uniref:Uncharacterized protein n=1 Tax=Arundo donax TaxID=35708 RepID=A0A0A9GRZ0_ARUDO